MASYFITVSDLFTKIGVKERGSEVNYDINDEDQIYHGIDEGHSIPTERLQTIFFEEKLEWNHEGVVDGEHDNDLLPHRNE